jgi:hypothetical protein
MTTTDSRHDESANARLHSLQGVVPLDVTFDALANQQCRVLVGHLADGDEDALVVTDLADGLADRLADRLADQPADQFADDNGPPDERRLRVDLHHTHLPKLDDAGLLDYDADRGLLQPGSGSQFEAIHSAIEEYRTADRPVSLDALFDLLADFRRRTAFLTLCSHGDLSLPDLADEVAVAERGETLLEIDPDEVLRVYLSLYHRHVPKLADEGLVAYDQDDDYVTLTETGRALESSVRDLCTVADA